MKKNLIIILTLFFTLFANTNSFANERNYYQELINNWLEIFPDKNRNAAGPKFFSHIIKKKDLTYKDFVEFNKLYCAVSGSLIDPNARPQKVYMTEVKTDKKICGDYYQCCIPCSCDVMKYAKVEKMKHQFIDVEKEFYVITIKSPCQKRDFPRYVNRDYFCDGENLAEDQVVVLNDRLVIGLYHEGKLCDQATIDIVDRDEVTGRFCEFRNNTSLDQLQGGMGDIFIKLAR